jgi:hypothetical protein
MMAVGRKREQPPLPGDEKKKVSRPYKAPNDLYKRMAEYFDKCSVAPDWREICCRFAELRDKAEEKGSWVGLEKDYQALAQAVINGACFPDEAGMRIHLNLSHDSYLSYLNDPQFEKVFNWAQDMRESWAARRLASEPRAAQAYLNILKQSGNGGWVDRKAEKADNTLQIRIADVGGEEAFQ